jgi:RNA polymerase sigma-70 factor (ECF subfamily)
MSDALDEFEKIYARHAADVYRFALRLSGDSSDAEDMTSEAFVRALASSEPIRTATVRGYLFTIARRYYLELLRRRARHVPLVESLRDAKPAPLARAEANSELAAVGAALGALPEVDRAALIMRAVHQMPYDEIARALRISVPAAKVKVHRARLALAAVR